MNWLSTLHFVGGVIVVSEALNKLQRTDLFDGKRGLLPRLGGLCWLVTPWRWKMRRVVLVLRSLGWALLAIGGGGALATPFIHLDKPSFQDVAVIAGFALLIVRSRLKEFHQ
jgi:hypothetical protein